MLRTANFEESDRRRAVRACAQLHENDSDTPLTVTLTWRLARASPAAPPAGCGLRPAARRAAAGAARRFLQRPKFSGMRARCGSMDTFVFLFFWRNQKV